MISTCDTPPAQDTVWARWLRALVLFLAATFAVAYEGCMRPDEAQKWDTASTAQSDRKEPSEQVAQNHKQPEPRLQYAFKPGERYAYALEIEADLGEAAEVVRGYLDYTVESADGFDIVLYLSGGRQLEMVSHAQPRPTSRIDNSPREFVPIGPNSRLTIDLHGDVLRNSSRAELPYFLGELATAVLDPLAAEELTWIRESTMTPGKTMSVGSPELHRQMTSPLSPLAAPRSAVASSPNSMTMTSGFRRVKYRRLPAVEGAVRIDKDVEIHYDVTMGATRVKIDVSGDGFVVFDLEAGAPATGRMTYGLTLTMPNSTSKIPIVAIFRRVRGEQLVELDKRLTEVPAMTMLGSPLSVEQTKILLAQLQDPSKAANALLRLRISQPNELRAEVAHTLENLLKENKKPLTQSICLRALGTWATKDSIPTLVPLLDSDVTTRSYTIHILGTLPDERSATALAKYLESTPNRGDAIHALIRMGSIAEDSVLPLLSSEDDLVRDRACQILGFIGTAKSLPKLEEIAATEQINAGHATTAVRKIKSRP